MSDTRIIECCKQAYEGRDFETIDALIDTLLKQRRLSLASRLMMAYA